MYFQAESHGSSGWPLARSGRPKLTLRLHADQEPTEAEIAEEALVEALTEVSATPQIVAHVARTELRA